MRLFKKPSNNRSVSVEELRGNTYATYKNSGVEVDLNRYFSTPHGKAAWEKIANSGPKLKQAPIR